MVQWIQIGIHFVVAMATLTTVVQSHAGHHHGGEHQPTPAPLITADGCWNKKGCFRVPEHCTGADDCEMFVSWTVDENMNSVFRMSGKSKGYVAVGFSKSDGMKNADVYACTKNSEVVRQWNNPVNKDSRHAIQKGIVNATVSYFDGNIRCSFVRLACENQPSLCLNDPTYFDLTSSTNLTYTLIMARHDEVSAEGGLVFHRNKYALSRKKLLFIGYWEPTHAYKPISGEEGEEGLNLQKAHGSLMVVAWVGFASLGIVMARFFKPMWPDTKICGVAIWFTFHRTFMVFTCLATIAAFIIIFIHTGEFFTPEEGFGRFLHAILGTIVTACVIINPVMALFRPHPGEPRRHIFNWAHWVIGTGGHTLAMVTIIIGLNIGHYQALIDDLPSRVFWVMIAFLLFHYFMWLLFEIQRCMTESKGRSNDIPLMNENDKGELLPQSDNVSITPEDDAYRENQSCQTTKEGSMAKTALLVIYVCGVFFTVLFMVISIILVD